MLKMRGREKNKTAWCVSIYFDSMPFLAFSDIEFNAVPQLLLDEGPHFMNNQANESQLNGNLRKLTHIQSVVGFKVLTSSCLISNNSKLQTMCFVFVSIPIKMQLHSFIWLSTVYAAKELRFFFSLRNFYESQGKE